MAKLTTYDTQSMNDPVFPHRPLQRPILAALQLPPACLPVTWQVFQAR